MTHFKHIIFKINDYTEISAGMRHVPEALHWRQEVQSSDCQTGSEKATWNHHITHRVTQFIRQYHICWTLVSINFRIYLGIKLE